MTTLSPPSTVRELPIPNFYDPEHAVARVIGQGAGLSATVFRLMNFADVDSSCYARFALLLARPQ